MEVARLHLEVALRHGAPVFSFVEKFNMMQARCVSLASARMASGCESDLSTESCLVDLSTTRGEGLSRRESQSGFSMVRQRGAMVLSCPCGHVSFRQNEN